MDIKYYVNTLLQPVGPWTNIYFHSVMCVSNQLQLINTIC